MCLFVNINTSVDMYIRVFAIAIDCMHAIPQPIEGNTYIVSCACALKLACIFMIVLVMANGIDINKCTAKIESKYTSTLYERF